MRRGGGLLIAEPGPPGSPRMLRWRDAVFAGQKYRPLRPKPPTSPHFDLNVFSEEFDRGVKQMVNYIEKKCWLVTEDQRQQLVASMDDIIFVLPKYVSVVFDQHGRKFCIVVMRFWLLSAHEGPDDPEASKIFKVAPSEDGSPQKKISTAVYEFHLIGRSPSSGTGN